MRFLILFLCYFSAHSQINILKPKERAVFQRNNANSGWVEVHGNLNEQCQSLEARLVPMAPGQGNQTGWQQIEIKNNAFSGKVFGSGGFYRLELQALTNQGTTLNKQIERVGIGEVFLVAGQSNTMIPGPLATDERVEAVSYTFGLADFPDFIDLTNRQNGLVTEANKWIYPSVSVKAFCGSLGDLLVKKLNVPVLFLVAGAGGSTVEMWYNSSKNGEQPYKNLNLSLNKFARAYGLRAILWHQGETNSIYKPTPSELYRSNLTDVINRSRDDLGYQQLPWVVARVSWSKYQVTDSTDPSDPNPMEFRNETLKGQNDVINSVPYVFAGPETDLIEGYHQSEYRDDGVHFSMKGQAKHGELWNHKLDNNFFNTSQPFLDYKTTLEFQSIFFPPIEAKTIQSEPFLLNAISSTGLALSFRIISGPANIINGAVKLTGQTGTVVVEAIQSGNQEYLGTSSQQTFRVLKSTQSINFPNIESKFINSAPFTLNATSSAGLPITYKIISGPAKLEANMIILNGLAGRVIIEASQEGNNNYINASPVLQTFDVNKLSQSIIFENIPSQVFNKQIFTLKATSSSGLAIKYKLLNGFATLENNQLTINKPSIITIEAIQEGNEKFLATTTNLSFEILKIKQEINFKEITTKFHNSSPFELQADINSNLKINFSIIAGPARINDKILELTGDPGKVVIEANQNGDDFYEKAEPKRREFDVLTLLTNEPQSDFIVFPNPAHNFVSIKTSKKIVCVDLITETGILIPLILTHIKGFDYQTDVNQIPSGLYFLRVKMVNNVIVNKLVISH